MSGTSRATCVLRNNDREEESIPSPGTISSRTVIQATARGFAPIRRRRGKCWTDHTGREKGTGRIARCCCSGTRLILEIEGNVRWTDDVDRFKRAWESYDRDDRTSV